MIHLGKIHENCLETRDQKTQDKVTAGGALVFDKIYQKEFHIFVVALSICRTKFTNSHIFDKLTGKRSGYHFDRKCLVYIKNNLKVSTINVIIIFL